MRKKRKVKEGEETKRVKRPRTTEAQRAVARTLAKEGHTQLEAARRTKMSEASVSNAIKRFKETGGDGNRKSRQNGRPRISTDRDDRFLTRTSLHDRFKPATKLKEEREKSLLTQVSVRFGAVFELQTYLGVLQGKSHVSQLLTNDVD